MIAVVGCAHDGAYVTYPSSFEPVTRGESVSAVYSTQAPIENSIVFDGKEMQFEYIKGALEDGTVFQVVCGHLGQSADGEATAWAGIGAPVAAEKGLNAKLSCERLSEGSSSFVFHLKSGWMGVEFTPSSKVLNATPGTPLGATGGTTPAAAPIVLWPIRWRFTITGLLSTGVNTSRYFAVAMPGSGTELDQLSFADMGTVLASKKSDTTESQAVRVPNGSLAEQTGTEAEQKIEIRETSDLDRDVFMAKAREFMKAAIKKAEGN